MSAARKKDLGVAAGAAPLTPIPGPYRFEPHGGFGGTDPDCNPWPFGYISTSHPSPIFSLDVILGYPREQLLATATVLAAAPDMLAALKSLLPQLLPDALAKDKGGLTPESRQRCMAIVKDAIAKASL